MSTRLSTKQSYSALAVIAVILVIALLAGAGVVAFKNKTNSAETTAASTSSAFAPAEKGKASELGLKPAESATVPFTVAELGVRFNIPKSLQNGELTYQIKEIQLTNGSTAKAAYFSTKQLAKAEAKCAANEMSIAAMAVGEGQYPKDDPNVAIDYGPLLKQLPEKFVTFLTARASCTAGKGAVAEKQLGDALADLTVSVKTVEEVN
jgi:hypothetical protein